MPKYFRPLNEIVYFSQRNNYGSPFNECFPTSMVMMMANNLDVTPVDQTLRAFMEDDLFDHFIEKTHKRTSAKYEWKIERDMANKWLGKSNMLKPDPVVWREGMTTIEIEIEIDNGRMVVVGTDKLGGLPGGHIVCIGGYDELNFYLWDPFGDYRTRYGDHNGRNISIKKDNPHIKNIRGITGYRVMTCHIEPC